MAQNLTKVLKAIKDSAGIVSAVADRLGVDWHTAKKYIEKWEATRAAFDDEQNKVADIAEYSIIKSIKDGNTQDAKWFLARIRKDKFSERSEITGADGTPLRVEYVNDWRNVKDD